MKEKLMKAFLAVVMVVPVFMPVFAVDAATLLSRLEGIQSNIADMQQEYNTLINTYPDVIDSLSNANKTAARDLANNMMSDNIEATINSIKSELLASSHPDASQVLTGINDLQDEAEQLIEDNKDVVNDLKGGVSNLTVEEAKQVVEKVKEITVSLGVTVDTAATYNSMMTTLNEAHTMALAINNRVKAVLANDTNLNLFKSSVTFDILEDLLDAVKAKDQVAVIDIIKNAVNGKAGAQALETELNGIKADAVALKNKLKELESLDEQDLLLFTDTQKTAVKNKIKTVETDYVNFAKLVINDHATDYLDCVVDLAYDVTVDQAIEKANKAIDYVVDYKDTINDLKNGDFTVLNLSSSQQDLIGKAGMLVALGVINIDSYNEEYITNNFQPEIDMLVNYASGEILDYVDYMDASMKKEVKDIVAAESNVLTAQNSIKTINSGRFTTLDNLKTLKARIETELINNKTDLKNKLNTAAPRLYDIYNNNILETIERIMLLENEKTGKKFEFNSLRYYLTTDKFVASSEFASLFGIPNEKNGVLSFQNLANGKVKTGSSVTITLSGTVYQKYTYAVLGDVYADGKVDARDYMAIKNQIMGKASLAEINKAAANTYRDSKIDARDYMAVKNQIMQKDTISL